GSAAPSAPDTTACAAAPSARACCSCGPTRASRSWAANRPPASWPRCGATASSARAAPGPPPRKKPSRNPSAPSTSAKAIPTIPLRGCGTMASSPPPTPAACWAWAWRRPAMHPPSPPASASSECEDLPVFDTLLIANRGEIACRIAATARRMGIRTVAVYSDADADARHVQACDRAVHIGGPEPAASYLRADAILDAARRTGAQAIHPGYGFLSENAGFARACADAGLIFVGPPADAIAAMGSKSAAKTLMSGADVPLVPGY